jgi:hypothetical protein
MTDFQNIARSVGLPRRAAVFQTLGGHERGVSVAQVHADWSVSVLWALGVAYTVLAVMTWSWCLRGCVALIRVSGVAHASI